MSYAFAVLCGFIAFFLTGRLAGASPRRSPPLAPRDENSDRRALEAARSTHIERRTARLYPDALAAQHFLQSAPIPLDAATSRDRRADQPHPLVGPGRDRARRRRHRALARQEQRRRGISGPLNLVAVLAVALGLGFALSAVVAYMLSHRLGLLEPPKAMTIRDVTLSEIARLDDATDTLDVTFQMDEEAFRSFYDRTARPVWAYLSRATRDNRLADDLLQETYYRFLRARGSYDRRSASAPLPVPDRRQSGARSLPAAALRSPAGRGRTSTSRGRIRAEAADRAAQRIDLSRAMARLKPRERDMLWLAYAQGSSHEEIAAALGLKAASIKSLLFRARRRLASLLGRRNA